MATIILMREATMRRSSRGEEQTDDSADWRAGLLRRAGLAPKAAQAVGQDERYDVHELLGLLESGCPPSLAIEIVRPLEDRKTP